MSGARGIPMLVAIQVAAPAPDASRAERLAELKAREGALQVKSSDIQVHIGQLREQQVLADPSERMRFQKPIADAQHENTVVMVDYEATRDAIKALESEPVVMVPPRADPLFGRKQLELTGAGIFLLMIPIVFALARRIWVRSGASVQPAMDLESSPRLQRMEQAIESIAIEVERIGEAQRFTTRLLSEQRPDGAVNRIAPVPVANPRQPGSITPH